MKAETKIKKEENKAPDNLPGHATHTPTANVPVRVEEYGTSGAATHLRDAAATAGQGLGDPALTPPVPPMAPDGVMPQPGLARTVPSHHTLVATVEATVLERLKNKDVVLESGALRKVQVTSGKAPAEIKKFTITDHMPEQLFEPDPILVIRWTNTGTRDSFYSTIKNPYAHVPPPIQKAEEMMSECSGFLQLELSLDGTTNFVDHAITKTVDGTTGLGPLIHDLLYGHSVRGGRDYDRVSVLRRYSHYQIYLRLSKHGVFVKNDTNIVPIPANASEGVDNPNSQNKVFGSNIYHPSMGVGAMPDCNETNFDQSNVQIPGSRHDLLSRSVTRWNASDTWMFNHDGHVPVVLATAALRLRRFAPYSIQHTMQGNIHYVQRMLPREGDGFVSHHDGSRLPCPNCAEHGSTDHDHVHA
jgi:hypothetical protein